MNRRYATGLVVGKFAPLHLGHVSVIDRAREQCDRVVLLSYSNPELPDCDPARREHWLTLCFPEATVCVVTNERLAAWFPRQHSPPLVPDNAAADDIHRDFCFMLCRDVLATRIDAVFTSEDYGPGFAARLTARYQETEPAAPAVEHVLVDRRRQRVPVSGTALRAALWTNWQFLPPAVARTLVRRVVFLGGESTGKSTLAATLAHELQTVSVAEYGRELWETQGGQLEYDDLSAIAREQIRREEAATATARAFVFCDTSPLTTLFYCQEMFGRAEPELHNAAARAYDRVYLCAPDFPFVQDGTRRDETFRRQQHAWYEAELVRRDIPFQHLRGGIGDRVASVRRDLFLQ